MYYFKRQIKRNKAAVALILLLIIVSIGGITNGIHYISEKKNSIAAEEKADIKLLARENELLAKEFILLCKELKYDVAATKLNKININCTKAQEIIESSESGTQDKQNTISFWKNQIKIMTSFLQEMNHDKK